MAFSELGRCHTASKRLLDLVRRPMDRLGHPIPGRWRTQPLEGQQRFIGGDEQKAILAARTVDAFRLRPGTSRHRLVPHAMESFPLRLSPAPAIT